MNRNMQIALLVLSPLGFDADIIDENSLEYVDGEATIFLDFDAHGDIDLAFGGFMETLNSLEDAISQAIMARGIIDQLEGEDIDAVTQRLLARIYEQRIGYNPFEDDPSATQMEVLWILIEHAEEELRAA